MSVELNELTKQETRALTLALAVLRSQTDYGDFLNSWLNDYGAQLLSANPPKPLLPELSEKDIPVVADAPFWVH